jgi:hypothetical protein
VHIGIEYSFSTQMAGGDFGLLTVEILTLSDKRLTETDLLKTGFLFEVSSFPCTFDRCLEPNTLYCMPNN